MSMHGRTCKEVWTNYVLAFGILELHAEMAMEVLKIHDANFASRPQSLVGKYASYDYYDIIFSKYGDHWC